jgi:hypothetical protein
MLDMSNLKFNEITGTGGRISCGCAMKTKHGDTKGGETGQGKHSRGFRVRVSAPREKADVTVRGPGLVMALTGEG